MYFHLSLYLVKAPNDYPSGLIKLTTLMRNGCYSCFHYIHEILRVKWGSWIKWLSKWKCIISPMLLPYLRKHQVMSRCPTHELIVLQLFSFITTHQVFYIFASGQSCFPSHMCLLFNITSSNSMNHASQVSWNSHSFSYFNYWELSIKRSLWGLYPMQRSTGK